MDTPICDFVQKYIHSGTMRLHMPGHKGKGPLGCESLDITEVAGADSLYEGEGIIAQSEANASSLFNCPTFYSTEGSSQCIRAMLYLVTRSNRRIAAARNVHKAFLSAAALLDLDVDWLYPENESNYLSCRISEKELERYFKKCTELPAAVYVTSPDYLGNMLNIAALAEVCHQHSIPLIVDNAHGAYLKFLSNNLHPMDQGADLCCDSAHKTLPVLTGGAYLHIRDAAFADEAKNALALFGSTSPSYLILQSLDAANATLSDPAYIRNLKELCLHLRDIRRKLQLHGISAELGDEPLKITLSPKAFGYTGTEIADHLRMHGVECEFSDPDFLVLMLTTAISKEDLNKLVDLLTALPCRPPIASFPPTVSNAQNRISIRKAMLSLSEIILVSESEGRILASASVGCPPAVPIVVCGEIINQKAIECFEYYGIPSVTVMK